MYMFRKNDLTVPGLGPTLRCAPQYAADLCTGKDIMNNFDRSHPSPNAAELYFERSIFGHLYTLLADALRRDQREQQGAQAGQSRSSAPRAPRADGDARPSTTRSSLLDRLEAWHWRQSEKEREAYLARATDVFDLERRIAAIDRNSLVRYY